MDEPSDKVDYMVMTDTTMIDRLKQFVARTIQKDAYCFDCLTVQTLGFTSDCPGVL